MNNDNYNNKKDKLLFLWLKPLSPFASLIGGVYRHDTEVNPAKSYNILNIFSLSVPASGMPVTAPLLILYSLLLWIIMLLILIY